MRLTLRTLLAWLDGVLPPEEQAQLGEKVSASQMASILTDRIHVAVARPAIAAPAPDARGLADDANSVAEFLDNTLSVDQLATFERICIDSEMHLAEVAACHSMLADMTRNPQLNLTVAGVQRLKRAVRERLAHEPIGGSTGGHASPQTGDALHESRETARAWRAALGSAVDHAISPDGRAGQAGSATELQTVYLPAGPVDATAGGRRGGGTKRPSWAAWWSAIVATALLLALLGVLGWSLFKGSGRRGAPVEVAANAAGRPVVEPAPPASAPVEPAATVPEEPAVAQTAAADAPPGGEESPPAMRIAAVDPPTPAAIGSVAVATAPPADAASTTPASTQSRMEPSSSATGSVTAPAVGTNTPSAAEPADTAFVVGGGTLLRLVKEGGVAEWRYAAPGTSLRAGEELLVPPWSEATITVRGVNVRLLPQTYVVFLLDRDGTPRADVLFGRTVIGGGQDSRLGITTGGISGVITADAPTRVAVEVGVDRVAPDDSGSALASARGFIGAGPRPFVWQPTAPDGAIAAEARPVQIAAGSAVAWQDGRATVVSGARQPLWLDAEGVADSVYPDRLHKSASAALAAKLAIGRPLLLSLRELADDRSRVENRIIAAATLALVGESDELVELLAADSSNRKNLTDQMWLTLERLAVPAALARGGEAAAGLHQSFIDRGPQDKGERLWAMARGFSAAELAAGADAILVESLDDPSLIVRRYAFKTLCDITQPSEADRLRYRPDGLADLRIKGVAWWQEQLARGLVRRRSGPPAQ